MGVRMIDGTAESIAVTDIGSKIIDYKEFKDSKDKITSVEVLFEGDEVGKSWRLVGHYSSTGEKPDRTPVACTTNDRWHKPGSIQEYSGMIIESKEEGMFVKMDGELAKTAANKHKYRPQSLNQSFLERSLEKISDYGQYPKPVFRCFGFVL